MKEWFLYTFVSWIVFHTYHLSYEKKDLHKVESRCIVCWNIRTPVLPVEKYVFCACVRGLRLSKHTEIIRVNRIGTSISKRIVIITYISARKCCLINNFILEGALVLVFPTISIFWKKKCWGVKKAKRWSKGPASIRGPYGLWIRDKV